MMQHIAAALERSPGCETVEDVADLINAGAVRLWPGARSAAVTETGRYFHVWLAGGDMAELLAMLDDAEKEHRERGFDMVTVMDARRGWARVLKSRGYVEKTILVKEL